MRNEEYQSWRHQKERGSFFLVKAMVWIVKNTRHFIVELLLYPICTYFLIFSRNARNASYSYLSRILDKPPKLRQRFHHFYVFSQTLVDRVFFNSNEFDDHYIEVSGGDIVEKYVQEGRGCLLLGSHLGSFDLVKIYGEQFRNVSIKILMDENMSPGTTTLFQSLDNKYLDNVIPVGTPGSILKIKELLSEGGILGILGDRVFDSQKSVRCKFLGKEASFPTGPILLAGILQVPIILFFGLRNDENNYKIYFELFSDQIILNREHRNEEVNKWVEKYVRRLEFYAHLAPYNWFNFFDIWKPLVK
jgi:predicted LPLAT superfamily acyltransferase